MAKWFGKIGYEMSTEIEPGIWDEGITEREYFGDIIRDTRKLQNAGEINDGVNISNQISIVADPFAYAYFHTMRYVEFGGTRWKVTDVEVQYPRLILSLGGVYNG